jgi:hypothetical protein
VREQAKAETVTVVAPRNNRSPNYHCPTSSIVVLPFSNMSGLLRRREGRVDALVSCRQATSGSRSSSLARTASSSCLIELTFEDATALHTSGRFEPLPVP